MLSVNQQPAQGTVSQYRAGLSQWRNGQLGTQAWQWQEPTEFQQYSPDPLPAIKQLLGTGRFRRARLRISSASGAAVCDWRNTLRLPLRSDLPLSDHPRVASTTAGSRLTTAPKVNA